MRYLILAALAVIILGPYLIWQFILRPYCIKHGQGYTAGANWGVTLWIDWQQARELANTNNDRRIRIACHLFLAIHICVAAVFVLAIFGAALFE